MIRSIGYIRRLLALFISLFVVLFLACVYTLSWSGPSCSAGIIANPPTGTPCDSYGAAVTRECNAPTGPTMLCPGARAQLAACQIAETGPVPTTDNITASDCGIQIIGATIGPPPPAPACDVTIQAGSSIQAAIDAHPAGTVFCLAAGTWYRQQFTSKTGDWFIGDPNGGTILDGDPSYCPNGYYQLTTGRGAATDVKLYNLTIQNYQHCPPHPEWHNENWGEQVDLGQGWIANNDVFQYSGGIGVGVMPGSELINSKMFSNGHDGVTCSNGGGGAAVVGSEIAYNNTNNDDPTFDAAGLKCVGNNMQILNNYVHDNNAGGIWSDIQSNNWEIEGNTVINNHGEAIRVEISTNFDVSHNVVSAGTKGLTGEFGTAIGEGIVADNSGNVSIHDNNVFVPNNGAVTAIHIVNYARPDAPGTESNDTIYNNTVTVAGSSATFGWNDYCGANRGGPSCNYGVSGMSSDNNTFCLANPSAGQFSWNTASALSWSNYPSTSGQDSTSTMKAGDCSVPGCTQIGCTGSGI